MAYVAISGEFMSRVTNKIRYMRDTELKTLGEIPKVLCTGNEPFLVNAVWGEHAHLMALMPAGWTGKADGNFAIRFKIPGTEADWFENQVALTQEIKLPPNFKYYDRTPVSAEEPVLAPLVDYAVRQREIAARWKEVSDKITNFLHSCKSANEAVKLWPDIKTYFDASDIERLEKKAERAGTTESGAAEVLKNIDTNQVMSAAVIARLSGAQV